MPRAPTLRVAGIAMAIAVCCGSAFAQLGGGGQPSNAGSGMGGAAGNPNAAVNPGINDALSDDSPPTVTRGDPLAGGNQVPPSRPPSANDDDRH
ncbi:MAG: hypothetical protein ACLPKB_02995 [Xanthobacteraceae bacterium]